MPGTETIDAVTINTQRPEDLTTVFATGADVLFARARARAAETGAAHAGSLYPPEAWALVQSGAAKLIDVRTAEELKFVGHVPDSLHIAWQIGPAMIKNPRFLRELESKAGRQAALILLCRSGKRSAAAASAASAAGFTQVFNVLEGFEGDRDVQQQRGDSGGWRHWNLPWVQD
ncbi:rhodanese-like domain-containing protein [Pseudomonas edaphica]|uniref:Rhodanese-like domain-containing protein n=1 Tax=Pseudomonas edaphica TaxID=2006980 RepID=A0ABY2U688_9PSED|nr:rhodanese-like domain-containing protein [Pseudomonas edaphica]TLG91080.1 rhodanese-like domain-containing protein [Pseudomonas edaphica]